MTATHRRSRELQTKVFDYLSDGQVRTAQEIADACEMSYAHSHNFLETLKLKLLEERAAVSLKITRSKPNRYQLIAK